MRRISNKAIAESTVLDSLNREIVPAIRGIQSAVIAIEGTSLVALEASIDALEADFVLIELDVADHETRVGALETAVADHETRVDDLEAADAEFRSTWVMGSVSNLGTTASTTYYHHVHGFMENGTPTTQINERRQMWGEDGTFTALLYQNMDSTADADTYSWTLVKNGSDTAFTFAGLAPNNTSLHEITGSVAVAKGDILVFKQVNGGANLTGTCNPSWWLKFVAA